MTVSVTVVDHGAGNISSVLNMLRRLGCDPDVARTPDEVSKATKLILPGVGAFDAAMRKIEDLGLADPIREFAEVGRGVLGICLGMQLLSEGSAEGSVPGLGLVAGRAEKFATDGPELLRLPHMGWNTVQPEAQSRLLGGMAPDARFYFAHSYHVVCRDRSDVAGRTTYGAPFVSVIEKANVWGTQFHPEKSHRHGEQVLSRFLSAID